MGRGARALPRVKGGPGRWSREPGINTGVGKRRTSHPWAPRPPTRGLHRPSALTVSRHGLTRGWGTLRGAQPAARSSPGPARSGAALRTAPPAARPRRCLPPRRPAGALRAESAAEPAELPRPAADPPLPASRHPHAVHSSLFPSPKTMNAATWKQALGQARAPLQTTFPLYSLLHSCFPVTFFSFHLIRALSFLPVAWDTRLNAQPQMEPSKTWKRVESRRQRPARCGILTLQCTGTPGKSAQHTFPVGSKGPVPLMLPPVLSPVGK